MDTATAEFVSAGTGLWGRRRSEREKSHAFTLIELLVVISLIGLLLALSLPAFKAARERGRQAVCMANLRSLGQAITIYASNNGDRLVPGDSPISWAVWAPPSDALAVDGIDGADVRRVNLGHLLTTGTLPMPTQGQTVLFCPSTRAAYGFSPPGELPTQWGSQGAAWITYMYNEALDGFGYDVLSGKGAVLSHRDVINFVRADGSVGVFRVQPVVFDDAEGPEELVEVIARYGVCFPTAMVFRWLEREAVDVDEARGFLCDPAAWYEKNSPLTPRKPVRLADVRSKPLVCDIVAHPVVRVTPPQSPGAGHG